MIKLLFKLFCSCSDALCTTQLCLFSSRVCGDDDKRELIDNKWRASFGCSY